MSIRDWNEPTRADKTYRPMRSRSMEVCTIKPNGAMGIPIWESSDVKRIRVHQYGVAGISACSGLPGLPCLRMPSNGARTMEAFAKICPESRHHSGKYSRSHIPNLER